MVKREELDREIERLRLENESLDDQVKLLVQTEQRLYRTRQEIDHRLTQIRSLAAFTLACSGNDAPETIVERALGVLDASFALEWATAFEIDGTDDAIAIRTALPPRTVAATARFVVPGAHGWAGSLAPVTLVPLPSGHDVAPPGPMLALAWGPGAATYSDEEPGILLAMPLRWKGGPAGLVLLAYVRERRRSAYRHAELNEQNVPFLELFASHLGRALETAELTLGLRERSSELDESNRRLTESLAELARTQQHLLQSRKMEAIGQLAGGIAHDFNNLLTVIQGYMELIQRKLPADSPIHGDVARTITAAERAAAITAQLLAVGRRQTQRRAPLDLNQLAETLSHMLSRLIGEQIRLELALEPDLPPVYADRAQIEQVLLNLVVNARDAMPDGGHLRIATRRGGDHDTLPSGSRKRPSDYAVLEVADDGAGMTEETLAHVFEPFYTTKEVGKGTGLGLSVVYGIIDQSDGHIGVVSAPGTGSRFTILLPFAEAVTRGQ